MFASSIKVLRELFRRWRQPARRERSDWMKLEQCEQRILPTIGVAKIDSLGRSDLIITGSVDADVIRFQPGQNAGDVLVTGGPFRINGGPLVESFTCRLNNFIIMNLRAGNDTADFFGVNLPDVTITDGGSASELNQYHFGGDVGRPQLIRSLNATFNQSRRTEFWLGETTTGGTQVTGNVNITLAGVREGSYIPLGAGSLTVGGNLTIRSLLASEDQLAVFNTRVNGMTIVALGGGNDTVNLGDNRFNSGIDFRGIVMLDLGAGNDTLLGTYRSATFYQTVIINSGTGEDRIQFEWATQYPRTGFVQNLTINTGSESDQVTLNGCVVRGTLGIDVGTPTVGGQFSADSFSLYNCDLFGAATFNSTGRAFGVLSSNDIGISLPTTFWRAATFTLGSRSELSFGEGITALSRAILYSNFTVIGLDPLNPVRVRFVPGRVVSTPALRRLVNAQLV